MSNVIDRAIEFATLAHRGQVRRYTGEPYIVHPVEVMEIVSTVSDDSEVLAAALLHDTVEDTPISLQDIRYEFGDRVAGLVDQLTDRSRPRTAIERLARRSTGCIFLLHRLRHKP